MLVTGADVAEKIQRDQSQSGDMNHIDKQANKRKKVWKVALATLTETYACTSGWRRDQGTQHTASKAAGSACIMQLADFKYNLMK